MLDEICLRTSLGSKISPGQLATGRFGYERQVGSGTAVVAISQTLDKLVVQDCENFTDGDQLDATTSVVHLENGADKTNRLLSSGNKMDTDEYGADLLDSISSPSSLKTAAYYIGVKDVIKTVAVKRVKALLSLETNFSSALTANNNNSNSSGNVFQETRQNLKSEPNQQKQQLEVFNKDLLIVGCFTRLFIYDTLSRSNLFTLNTPTPINAIASGQLNESADDNYLCACGGPQRLYLIKFDAYFEGNIMVEITSERSIEETVNCIAWGHLEGINLVLVGSIEQKISVYQLDTFDQNIQACRLKLGENSQVNCLLPINTVADTLDNHDEQQEKADAKYLPHVVGNAGNSTKLSSQLVQMNYFAFALESGLIGVYRLFTERYLSTSGSVNETGGSVKLSSERVWRYRCKHVPISMLLCDVNGDGLDELVIGFKSGRIEARLPFTGQLVSVARAFKQEQRLAGLALLDDCKSFNQGNRLIACATNGALIGFRPLSQSLPRKPLRGFKSSNTDKSFDGGLLSQSDNFQRLDWTGKQQQFAAFKRIEEEEEQQQKDIFIGMDKQATAKDGGGSQSAADLHIESKSDETKTSKCDSMQNLSLLQRVDALHDEQLSLQKRVCRIYQANVQQVCRFKASQVNIAHRWDFDSNAVCLRLTIVISTANVEEVQLVELEDESRNFLTNGYLLVSTTREQAQNKSKNHKHDQLGRLRVESSQEGGKSHLIVVPMRSQRDAQCGILVKVYCSTSHKQQAAPSGQVNQAAKPMEQVFGDARVCCKRIEVPKYSMFVLASTLFPECDPKQQLAGASNELNAHNTNISLSFRLEQRSKVPQIVRWLQENFLCLQFTRLINDSAWQEEGSSQTLAGLPGSDANPFLAAPDTLMMDDDDDDSANQTEADLTKSTGTQSFELQLVDIRGQFANESATDEFIDRTADSKCSDKASATMIKCKSTKQQQQIGYTLRIAYSNGWLTFDSERSDLVVHLVQSLVIDRLQLELTADKLQEGQVVANLQALLDELDTMSDSLRQLEESEKRIQSELYESADYTKNLMQQLAIANELNEFTLAKELLNELYMMLCGAQNAARTLSINNQRTGLARNVIALKEKIAFLSGNRNTELSPIN